MKLLRKPKGCTLTSLTKKKKSRIIEASAKLWYLFLPEMRQKVKSLFFMQQKDIFLKIKNYSQFLTIPFQTLFQN